LSDKKNSRLEQEARRLITGAQGSRTVAVRALVQAVLQDDLLLRELVAQAITPLAGRYIDRLMGNAPAPRSMPAASPTTGSSSMSAPNALNIRLTPTGTAKSPFGPAGYNPMKATQMPRSLTPEPHRPEASSRHVRTLHLLAAAYRVKRGEDSN
jgi:hypothetical protein